MRFFIGIELAIPLIERLVLLQEELQGVIQDAKGDVRWTPAEQLRLNLMVLPQLETGTLQRLQDHLIELSAAQAPFSFELRGTQATHVPHQARLITSRVESNQELLQGLRDQLHENAEFIGVPQDPRPWHPLVLLGRLATPHEIVPDFDAIFAPFEETLWGSTHAKEIVISRAEIVGRAERVRTVKRFALGSGL